MNIERNPIAVRIPDPFDGSAWERFALPTQKVGFTVPEGVEGC